jgi:hypothetical protein
MKKIIAVLRSLSMNQPLTMLMEILGEPAECIRRIYVPLTFGFVIVSMGCGHNIALIMSLLILCGLYIDIRCQSLRKTLGMRFHLCLQLGFDVLFHFSLAALLNPNAR